MKWLCMTAAAAGAMVLASPSSTRAGDDAGRYDWSGPYFGGSIGLASTSVTAFDARPPFGGYFTPTGPATGDHFKFSTDGFLGGDQIGILRQSGPWVAGLELAGFGSSLQQSIASPYYPATDRQSLTVGPIVMGSVRLGYAADRFMAYAKAGVAGASFEFHARDFSTGISYQQSSWQSGLAAGGGFEYAIYDGIRVGIDYTYADIEAGMKSGTNSAGGAETYRLDPGGLHAVTLRVNMPLGRRDEPAGEPLK